MTQPLAHPTYCRSAALALVALAVSALALATNGGRAHADQPAFGSPTEAVDILMAAVKAHDVAGIIRVLGDGGEAVAQSGDAVDDFERRTRFAEAYTEAHEIRQDGQTATLIVGADKFPFPIPLVNKGGSWRWDTAAGLDELLTRRIGQNELAVIKVLSAYVTAQNEYAQQNLDGRGPQFARRLLSRAGKRDGLYWPTTGEEEPSPLGPLVAAAQSAGYRRPAAGTSDAYHGYRYRILYAQGANAVGGAREYIVGDRMIGGFALIATPAAHGSTGIMTFIVNQDGQVFEKNLGPDTEALAQRIRTFDPDPSWTATATRPAG